MARAKIRYRSVSVQVHSDERYLALDGIGQHLWLVILTHPQMTQLGAMMANRAGLSAELAGRTGWSTRAVERSFDALVAAGMILVDAGVGLLVVPKFPVHNPPANQSVVAGWETILQILPACALLDEHFARWVDLVEPRGPKWAQSLPLAMVEARNRVHHRVVDRAEHGPSHRVGHRVVDGVGQQDQDQEEGPKGPTDLTPQQADVKTVLDALDRLEIEVPKKKISAIGKAVAAYRKRWGDRGAEEAARLINGAGDRICDADNPIPYTLGVLKNGLEPPRRGRGRRPGDDSASAATLDSAEAYA